MDDTEILKDYPFVTKEFVTKLLKDCPGASEQDVVKRVLICGPNRMTFPSGASSILSLLERSLRRISKSRINERLKGREHVEAGPLLNVHSVHVKPKKALKKRKLAVCGTIRVRYENITSGEKMKLDVYNRSSDNADKISSCGGYLTLGWPDSHLIYDDLWVKLHKTTIEVDLYYIVEKKVYPFAQENILLGDTTEGDFEEVRSKKFHSHVCSATLIYIAMPFAVLCKVSVRPSSLDMGRVVNIAGKIVARYKNTFGNYTSEPCILFEKQVGFEQVKVNNELPMSRVWLGLPAYSSLELDLDLRDFDTNKNITHTVELLGENCMYAREYGAAVDDFAIAVDAGLYSYPLNGIGFKDCYSDDFELESSSSNNGNLWYDDQKLKPSPLVEFYSIFIGCRKRVALKVVGTVEFSCNGNTHYLFKSDSNDGVEVEDTQKVLPLKVACINFDQCALLELKVNLEDVGGNFQNSGFSTCDLGFGLYGTHFNTQICSVFPGKKGFCALQYSLFPRACQANIEIIFNINSFRSGVQKIYGSAFAEYSNFDYSTKFKKDYFRSMLFKRTKKDAVQLKKDGEVPLSRNVVAVPMDSSLIIDIALCGMSLKHHVSCRETFSIGHCSIKHETNDYELEIKLTWSDGLWNSRSELDKDKV